jgi:hypothetical protein
MYFAKRLSIAFPLIEEKEAFDNWFYQQEFSSVDDVIEKVDSFIKGNRMDVIIDEEAYVKSVYKEYFGESWYEEYSRRN